MPVTSQLTDLVWLRCIADTVIQDTSNLDLRSFGKLDFKPRGSLSSAARVVKVNPEHSCTRAPR